MKNSQITVIELVEDSDVQKYRDATGFVLEVGNVVVQGILNDTPEGIRVFSSGDEAQTYIAEKVFKTLTLKEAVQAGPKKKPAKKAVKKPAAKKPAKAAPKKRGPYKKKA